MPRQFTVSRDQILKSLGVTRKVPAVVRAALDRCKLTPGDKIEVKQDLGEGPHEVDAIVRLKGVVKLGKDFPKTTLNDPTWCHYDLIYSLLGRVPTQAELEKILKEAQRKKHEGYEVDLLKERLIRAEQAVIGCHQEPQIGRLDGDVIVDLIEFNSIPVQVPDQTEAASA